MTDNITLLASIPVAAGILTLLVNRRMRGVKEAIALLATAAILWLSITMFKREISWSVPWLGFEINLAFRLYHFSAFMVLSISAFAFLFVLYCCSFMQTRPHPKQLFSYLLLTAGMANGVVLADNLVLMLFFWEGMLITSFGLIFIGGGKDAFKTATKAFIILGICDLCLMLGVGLTGYLAGTMTISKISIHVGSLGSMAFILLLIGAMAKGGAMPFHSWIPDAAIDAPLPFMALMPGSLEKLLGIYFLTRISLDMFKLDAGSWLSTLLMVIGGLTILLAVMMALVQKDYKRLLSYHAISQVGYMILGIGTCLPAGIIGGLFHMINNALYKSCLFLTGGSVEKQAGTTDLGKLGGIAARMPVTFLCFAITAASISGVPPFNGFFSKELVYDAALERGVIFYLFAIVGSFFTAASFLKLGHAAYLDRPRQTNENVREAPLPMLLPMIVLAAVCVIFGVRHQIAVDIFKPVLGEEWLKGGHEFASNTTLVTITIIVLVGALLHHLAGAKINGSGLKASDHIRHAPLLNDTYDMAEKRYFDPYDIVLAIVRGISRVGWWVDRGIDWLYDGLSVRLANALSGVIRAVHTGSYSLYVLWALIGAAVVVIMLIKTT